eukprot:CAMPEP_0185779186 /NCGR_PEP_ID=MMETSP1174-20130828/94983_1 /TAXON_ID=35687 /ORGANISM="Dictyocha speculum, Strain CCMP1381" /LENGTH=126 /DNA_ID=CAMNT_0028468219 /DNA_START=9 /DNA_END=386 /DNA_ORIENTATION=+
MSIYSASSYGDGSRGSRSRRRRSEKKSVGVSRDEYEREAMARHEYGREPTRDEVQRERKMIEGLATGHANIILSRFRNHMVHPYMECDLNTLKEILAQKITDACPGGPNQDMSLWTSFRNKCGASK